MNPEKQRIAVAKVCGISVRADGSWYRNDEFGFEDGSVLPNYLSDLNAMHEAEKVLDGNQFFDYLDCLGMITSRSGSAQDNLVCATAAQRAEAFLRTLNLWQD